MLRTLFLQAPSFDGFDGGAGSRYQAKREIRSFWFPTWLAQPAALVPGSKLIDAPPSGVQLSEVVAQANDFDLVILHTSVPSFASDVKCVEAMKAANPRAQGGNDRGEGGGEGRRKPQGRAGRRFRLPKRVRLHGEGRRRGQALVADPRPQLPRPVRRDRPQHRPADDRGHGRLAFGDRRLPARPEDRGLLHRLPQAPYISVYTGRGCKSRCTFCLWPQTVGGHRYRTRSVENVVAEIAEAKRLFPQVKEFFFDDDTFTDDLPRAEAIAAGLASSASPGPATPRRTCRARPWRS